MTDDPASGTYLYQSPSEHSSSEALLDNMASGLLDVPVPTVEQVDSVSIRSIDKDDLKESADGLPKAKFITSKGNAITKDGVVFTSNDSGSSLDGNIFKDPEIRDYYKQVYEDAKYECRHVFDPNATWTAEEEHRVVRKLDWRVCLWACTMFFSQQIDRNNLVQAVSGTLLQDLHLTTNGMYKDN